MTCCPPVQALPDQDTDRSRGSLEHWVREVAPGQLHMDLLVPSVHCAACISRVERSVKTLPGVIHARLNLSTKRLAIDWQKNEQQPQTLLDAVEHAGYDVRPFLLSDQGKDEELQRGRLLLRSLAVAGFAAANVMLLSISVWSGADASSRDLFHWISALIALPAIVYAGRPFFHSAYNALSARHLNMDVPISLAVILAAIMSLVETMQHEPHAYFDAAITLLFFLLIGRYLDYMMRAKARSAVSQLLALNATGATIITPDGKRVYLPVHELKAGMIATIAAGERVPVDGEVSIGVSDIDCALITGESIPEAVHPGTKVHAGTMNLTGPLHIKVTSIGDDTLLAAIIRLMEAAESSKTHYINLADRAAQIYAPAVHVISAATFIGWMFYTGGDWRQSLMAAIAVLIITCPCALGLAVPVVQVVASGILFRAGILVKDGNALERLSNVSHIAFDKTGTLTKGRPRLLMTQDIKPDMLAVAAGLAAESRHPLARAIADYASECGIQAQKLENIREYPGAGLEGMMNGESVRLGNRIWCEVAEDFAVTDELADLPEVCLSLQGQVPIIFCFEDEMRRDVKTVIAELSKRGLTSEILSGDRKGAVARLAQQAGISDYRATLSPADKATYINALAASERKVLMVGDGINDAPALAAAYVSMAPASGSDIGQAAADLVFTNDGLWPVNFAQQTAGRAERTIKQNFGLAIAYNLIAIPLAVLGLASPLVAAIAMSSSSLIVTLNALRLRLHKPPASQIAPTSDHQSDPAISGIRSQIV